MATDGKKSDIMEDSVELDETFFKEDRNLNVVVENLTSFGDTEKVLSQIRDGKIVFLRIKELRMNDINELKKAVEKLKKTINASDGDIVGVEEDVLIICPSMARVFRGY